MKKSKNYVPELLKRELYANYSKVVEKKLKVTDTLIQRLGLSGELEGHTGCVNCLEWNRSGSLLASGSDDALVNIYNPFRNKLITSVPTGHQGNIFSVKFVPNTCDHHVISGAADYTIRIHDVTTKDTLGICSCHSGRVKRLATDPTSSSLYWSAGEDGLIIQHDLRETHSCAIDSHKPDNILIDLKAYIGPKAEAKCLTLNPVRPELIGVGANDPFARLYDRRMIKLQMSGPEPELEGLGSGTVQYFVPGHLPSRSAINKRKFRSLAATFVSFSSDGTELLVNLGGEQIYLFPLISGLQNTNKKFCFTDSSLPCDQTLKEQATAPNGYKNGHVHHDGSENDSKLAPKFTDKKPLPSDVEAIKVKANEAFAGSKYTIAITLYNEAIARYPESAVLYGNRAAALLKRGWDGDAYESLKDCYCAVTIDPQHNKAFLRMCRSLYELGWFDESLLGINQFKTRFPKHASGNLCKSLEEDLAKAIKKAAAASAKTSKSSSRTNSSSSDQSLTFSESGSSGTGTSSTSSQSGESGRDRNFFLRFTSHTFSPGSPTSDSQEPGEIEEVEISGVLNDSSRSSEDGQSAHGRKQKQQPKFHDSELDYQDKAFDYIERFCGHCNTTTDIKEANFFGESYIVAGSDDGSFFIWNRETTNIVKVIRGDESIVNCLQPHPSTCLLATSGIESVIRLWSPLPEDDKTKDERIVEDWDNAALANQKRMKSNPFEMLLMNMGYHLNNSSDNELWDEGDADSPNLRCNPT